MQKCNHTASVYQKLDCLCPAIHVKVQVHDKQFGSDFIHCSGLVYMKLTNAVWHISYTAHTAPCGENITSIGNAVYLKILHVT